MTVVHNRHDHRPGLASDNRSMDDDNAEVVSLPQAPDAIELRHLRAFVAVADELNFGRAAARLYLSQPALSRQIRNLERLVGCDLLRRSTHRVELTLAGEALLDRARGLLRDVDEAVSATRSVGGELLARIGRHWESFAEVSPADLQELRVAFEALHGSIRAAAEHQRAIGERRGSAGTPGHAPARGTRHPALPARRRVCDRLGVRLPAAGRSPGRTGRDRCRRPGLPPGPRASLPGRGGGRRTVLPLDAGPGRDPDHRGRRLGRLRPGPVVPAQPQAAAPPDASRRDPVLPLGRPHGGWPDPPCRTSSTTSGVLRSVSTWPGIRPTIRWSPRWPRTWPTCRRC